MRSGLRAGHCPDRFRHSASYELMADLKENLLELRDAFAGFGLEIYGPLAEFLPEFGIGHEAARLFVRKSRPFGEAAKRVIHRPVQTGEERDDLLTLALLLSSEGILRGPDRDIHQKIPLNRRPAEPEVYLRLDRDPLHKFLGKENFLAA